ncbi:MAG: 2'-5' RNA ligase family protein [candidate division WOR-3 bacterium]
MNTGAQATKEVVPATRKPEGWEIPYLPGSLVILPPDPVRQRIGRLRRKYDSLSAQRIPPHITVAQPFRQDPDRTALEQVRQILVEFDPFEVRYGPIRNFLPYPCIWFEVQPADRIIALRNTLHATGLFNTDLPHTEDFIPHISITDGTPGPEETLRIYNRIRTRVKSGSFLVDRVAYVRPNWQLRFLTVTEIKLGKLA